MFFLFSHTYPDPSNLSTGLGVRGIFRILLFPPSKLLATLCQLSSLPLELLLVREGLRITWPVAGFRNFVELLLERGEERGESTDESGGGGFGVVGLGGDVVSGDEVRDRSVITGEVLAGKDLRGKLWWRDSATVLNCFCLGLSDSLKLDVEFDISPW